MRFYMACLAQKHTLKQLGRLFVVKANSPYHVVDLHREMCPDEPKCDGESNYMDYLEIDEETAMYCKNETKLPCNF